MKQYTSWIVANCDYMGIEDSYFKALKQFGKLEAPATVIGETVEGCWVEVRRK